MKKLLTLSFLVILSAPSSVLSQTKSGADTNSLEQSSFDPVVTTYLLQHERELNLNPQQVKSLLTLRTEFKKSTLTKLAALQLAEMELKELQAKSPVDSTAIEEKIRQSQAIKTELRIEAERTDVKAKAALTSEQMQKLDTALAKTNVSVAGSDDRHLQEQIRSVLEEKYKDQKSVELETSQAIAARLLDWAKTFGIIIGIPLTVLGALLGFFGIKSLSDIRTLADSGQKDLSKTVTTAKDEIATVVSTTNKGIGDSVATAKQGIAESVHTAKEGIADSVTTAKQGIEDSMTAAKRDIADLVGTGKAGIEETLGQAQEDADLIKSKGDALFAKYRKLETQLDAVEALAKGVPELQNNLRELTTKVESIEETISITSSGKIPAAKKAKLLQAFKDFQKYFQQIGFEPPKGGQLKVVIDNKWSNSAVYDPKSNTMNVAPSLIDDFDVSLNQYVYHALSSVNPAALDDASWQTYAIESGLAAYFTCSFTNDPLLAEKSAHIFERAEGYLANLDNTRSFTEIPEDRKPQETHDAGEVWGGAFWDIRKLLGQQRADKLLFSTWKVLSPADLKDESGMGFVKRLLKHSEKFEGEGSDPIKAVFVRRGLDV